MNASNRPSEQTLRALETAPNIYLILSPDLYILTASDLYLQATENTREWIVGKHIFEAFPTNPDFPEGDGVQNINASLQEVLRTKKTHYMRIQRYDVPDIKNPGKFIQRYWDPSHTPVFDENGEISYIIQLANNVTDQVLASDALEKSRIEQQETRARVQVLNEELISSRAARVQHQRMNRFFMQAPVGICMLSGTSKECELVNTIFEQLFPGRNLHGISLFDALPEFKESLVDAAVQKVLSTGETQQLSELQLDYKAREENTYITLSFQARLNDQGNVDGVIIFAFNVTEQVLARKNAEASATHFRHLADLVPSKISNALPTGEVTFFNQHWLDFSGMNFEDLRDFGYHQMMHPDEVPEFQQKLAQAAADKVPLVSELRFKNTSGEYIWHLNIASPIIDMNGEIVMWVGSTTDIQHIKEEEQRKNDFIGMVSHELKTPLTSLIGHLQILQLKMNKTGEDSARKSVEQSLKQTRKMTGMINSFLNVTQLESGQIIINKAAFHIQDLFNDLEAELVSAFPTHEINLHRAGTALVLADQDKIGQVLTNIISNAVKYSSPGTMVDVSYRVNEDQVIVSVSDQGKGIPAEHLENVFKRFYRVEPYSQVSGFGIGLYLCAEIIKRLDGEIWAESKPGEGSTFYFSLPFLG